MPQPDRTTRLASAALRHAMDAERLLSVSPDQSWHLAGFAPECARKACLGDELLTFDKLLGHELWSGADSVLDFALALDPRVARYAVLDVTARFPRLGDWLPEHRYDATRTRDEASARGLVEQALEFTCALTAELWMDGRITEVR